MKKCSFIPYEGNNAYVFASYCHEEKEIVYPVLEELNRRGVRIWYDEGIDWGDEWPETVATHLDNCQLCLVFLSPKYSKSKNCKNELTFASNHSKKIACLHISPGRTSLGIELQTSYDRKITYEEFLDKERLYSLFMEIEGYEVCLNKGNSFNPPQTNNDASTKRNQILVNYEAALKNAKSLWNKDVIKAEKIYDDLINQLMTEAKINPDQYLPPLGETYLQYSFFEEERKWYFYAIRYNIEAQKVYKQLASSDDKYKIRLAKCYRLCGGLYISYKDDETKGIEYHTLAFNTYKEIQNKSRKLLKEEYDIGIFLVLKLGKKDSIKGINILKELIEELQNLPEKEKTDFMPQIAECHYASALLYGKSSNFSQAGTEAEKARDIYDNLSKNDGDRFKKEVKKCQEVLDDCIALRDAVEQEPIVHKTKDQQNGKAKKDQSQDDELQRLIQLADKYLQEAEECTKQPGMYQAAIIAYTNARKILEKLSEVQPERFMPDELRCCSILIDNHKEKNHKKEIEKYVKRKFVILCKLAHLQPDHYLKEMTEYAVEASDFLKSINKSDDAAQMYSAALTINRKLNS